MSRGMRTPAWTLNLVAPHLRVGRKEKEREKERVGESYILGGRVWREEERGELVRECKEEWPVGKHICY